MFEVSANGVVSQRDSERLVTDLGAFSCDGGSIASIRNIASSISGSTRKTCVGLNVELDTSKHSSNSFPKSAEIRFGRFIACSEGSEPIACISAACFDFGIVVAGAVLVPSSFILLRGDQTTFMCKILEIS